MIRIDNMGESLGIDDIITMDGKDATIKKSEPKIREKITKKLKQKTANVKHGQSNSEKEAYKTERKRTLQKRPKTKAQDSRDVSEIIKEAKNPPTKENAQAVVEAALFMSSGPLMLDQIAKISGVNSLGYLKQMLSKLQKEYENRGIEINCSTSGWQMQVCQKHLSHVAHLTPYSDMPEGCKRTLALIVYKEPMKQSDLVRIQGNKAYTYIKKLKRSGLVRLEKRGRNMVLKLTQEFDRYFGNEKDKIRQSMVEEFGDPAKIFPEIPKEQTTLDEKLSN